MKLFTSVGGSICRAISAAVFGVCIALAGCASAPGPSGAKKAGDAEAGAALSLLPKDAFKGVKPAKSSTASVSVAAGTPPTSASKREVMVTIYASAVTAKTFQSYKHDYAINVQQWEQFLKKYQLPYRVIRSVQALESLQGGTVLLPSAVALSTQERNAIQAFRARGGDILASWMTGVRDEKGDWAGFDFMQRALDVQVLGDTRADEEDTFLIADGGSPISHHLPAGMRLWLERAQGWFPLRMRGLADAGAMLNWSRAVSPEKTGATIAFGERGDLAGSRAVVLGFPERLWPSADPRLMESLVHNALLWALHQPDVYASEWPHPYSSATVLAIEGVDNFGAIDAEFSKRIQDHGFRGTYLISAAELSKSLKVLKEIAQRGHEFAYFGDSFAGFRGQALDLQRKRLESMRTAIQASSLPVARDAGFRAPMDAYDKTTQQILREAGFGYHIAFMDSTDACLPVLPGAETGSKMVVLPRVLPGPEEAAESDPEEGISTYAEALKLFQRMGCLAVVTIPNQSLLTPEQQDEIFSVWDAPEARTWKTSAAGVAQWWRERERIKASLQISQQRPYLHVTVTGDTPLAVSPAVWVNVPEQGGGIQLLEEDGSPAKVTIADVDRWRKAVLLKGLPPGKHQWRIRFINPSTSAQ